MMRAKMGKWNPSLIALDIIGFVIMIIGGVALRYLPNQPPIQILAGILITLGASILGISRWLEG